MCTQSTEHTQPGKPDTLYSAPLSCHSSGVGILTTVGNTTVLYQCISFIKKHRCTSELIKVCSIKSSSVAFLVKIRNDQRTSNSMGLDSFPALSVLFLQKYCSLSCILATISCTESKLWENLGRKSLPFLCVGSHQG
jgi:hypothetical protein